MKSPTTTCVTCDTPCWSTSTPAECGDCRNRRTAGEFWSPDVLTDGRWVGRGGVMVWQPAKRGKRIAKCGTDGGYYRHIRRTKTEPCDRCKAAHAAAERERQERARRTAA